MIFKKNIDVINKFQCLENKVDDLLNRFEILSFSQENTRCCDCEKREKAIYKDLTEYLDSKFTSFENDIIHKLEESKNSDLKSVPHLTHEDIKSLIDNHKTSLTQELENICSVSDKNLRLDLNSLLLGMKSDIIIEIKKYYQIQETNIREVGESQKNKILEVGESQAQQVFKLSDKQNVMMSKIDAFSYDNEMIKHQLLLEEEIRTYYDEITSLKNTIDKTLKDIDQVINQHS